MKLHWAWSMDGKGRFLAVPFEDKFSAEIERDRLRFSESKRIGVTIRPLTEKRLRKEVAARWPFATVEVIHRASGA